MTSEEAFPTLGPYPKSDGEFYNVHAWRKEEYFIARAWNIPASVLFFGKVIDFSRFEGMSQARGKIFLGETDI